MLHQIYSIGSPGGMTLSIPATNHWNSKQAADKNPLHSIGRHISKKAASRWIPFRFPNAECQIEMSRKTWFQNQSFSRQVRVRSMWLIGISTGAQSLVYWPAIECRFIKSQHISGMDNDQIDLFYSNTCNILWITKYLILINYYYCYCWNPTLRKTSHIAAIKYRSRKSKLFDQ